MLGSRAVPHYMGPSGTIGGIPGMSMGGVAADPYYSGLTGRHRAEAYYPPPPSRFIF
jgi:hypothetical protein